MQIKLKWVYIVNAFSFDVVLAYLARFEQQWDHRSQETVVKLIETIEVFRKILLDAQTVQVIDLAAIGAEIILFGNLLPAVQAILAVQVTGKPGDGFHSR